MSSVAETALSASLATRECVDAGGDRGAAVEDAAMRSALAASDLTMSALPTYMPRMCARSMLIRGFASEEHLIFWCSQLLPGLLNPQPENKNQDLALLQQDELQHRKCTI